MTRPSRPKDIPPEKRLIFALDVPALEEAERLLEILRPEVHFFKVGLELFLAAGFEVVERIAHSGAEVFLDLKLLDIPATVHRALRVIGNKGLPISLVTLHPLHRGFPQAERQAGFPGMRLLIVPVLTSMAEEDLSGSGGGPTVRETVSRLAGEALQQGFDGVIASGLEAPFLREAYGEDLLIVAPGIRPAWASVGNDDQKRVVTPAAAMAGGVDYIVVGRPIRDYPHGRGGPLEAARRIQAEIGEALA